MAYDPVKAHEYYINYRKKGLKKGRKKGKGTAKSKGTTSTLLGVSIAGLNDEGKIQGALIKEKLKKQMNEELKKATTDEEKEKIRVEYSRKATQQIAALRANSKYAKPKAARATKAKTSTSTSSSPKSKKRTKGIVVTKRNVNRTKQKATKTKISNFNIASAVPMNAASNVGHIMPISITDTMNYVSKLKSMTGMLTDTQKATAANIIKQMIKKITEATNG